MTKKPKPKRATTRRKKADSDEAMIHQAVQFYLDNKRLKGAEAYAAGGRRFKGHSAPELREVFAAAYRQMAITMSPESGHDYDDCESEYILRGESLPEGVDMAESKTLMVKRAEEMAERIYSDKGLLRQLGRELLEDVLADLDEETSKGEH